jgi:amino acid transporter
MITEDPTPASGQAPPGSGQAGNVSLDVFSRKTSGIVREFTLTDVAWYGILAAGAVFALLWIFPFPYATMAGLSVPLSALIAMVLMIPVFATYAGLGSAMPRMGGDYLFQSRTIHPIVGFAFTFAWEVFIWVTFTTTGGLVVATLGIQPILYNVGLSWKSQSLISAANWAGGANGILVITLIVLVAAFLTCVGGLRIYRSIQRWFIVPTVVLSNVLLIVLFLHSHASFASHVNAWYLKATGDSNFAATLQKAVGPGFHAPGFSLKYTILFVSVSGVIWYAVFSAQGLLGEIKHANSFSRLFWTFTWAGAFVGVLTWILPMWLLVRSAGAYFVNAYATGAVDGTIQAPAGGSVPAIAMMMTSNPLLIFLTGLGFISVGFYFSHCVFLNMTRVMGAMGMDRSLPEWFAKVSQRYHAPLNAAVFYFFLALVLNFLFRFVDSVKTTMVYAGAFTSVSVIAVSGLAAILFPYTARSIYDVSPVARYKIFGIPMIVISGAIALVGAGSVTVMNLVFPELGFTTWSGRLFLVFTPIVSAAWLVGYRAYLKRRGFNIDLAFRQLPPE